MFTYLVSEIGETRDAKRWQLNQNDLIEATALYSQFQGSPTYFSSPSGGRCKVVPFEDFGRQPHWLVDRWWTQEEHRKLGNATEESVVSDEELQEIVKGLQGTLALVEPNPASTIQQLPYREIGLDSVDFEVRVGRRRLKKDMISEGIPVYSANPSEIFGYVLATDWEEFDRPALLWGIDGTFDWGLRARGPTLCRHRPLWCSIRSCRRYFPRYLYHELRATKEVYGFDRTYRANLENVLGFVKIRIPVRSDGSYDLEAQQEIAAKYDRIQSLQDELTQQLKALSGMKYEWQHFADGAIQ